MRHFHLARRAGVPAAVALAGLFAAGPALADATVSPSTAEQGSGQNLSFHVVNTGAQPIGEITLQLPSDTPVAEVYPLSDDRWAPKISMRTLATPLPTIHGGTPATETTSAITWIAMPGKPLPAGQATDVAVAIGPLPTLSSMRFTLVTKFSDGKPGPTMTTQVALTPSTGQAPAGHLGHDGTGTATTDGDTSAAEQALFEQAVADAQRGPSIWSIGGWVVAGLAILGGAVMMFRGRHRAEDDDEPDEDESLEPAVAAEPKEPAVAGKWSYRG